MIDEEHQESQDDGESSTENENNEMLDPDGDSIMQ